MRDKKQIICTINEQTQKKVKYKYIIGLNAEQNAPLGMNMKGSLGVFDTEEANAPFHIQGGET